MLLCMNNCAAWRPKITQHTLIFYGSHLSCLDHHDQHGQEWCSLFSEMVTILGSPLWCFFPWLTWTLVILPAFSPHWNLLVSMLAATKSNQSLLLISHYGGKLSWLSSLNQHYFLVPNVSATNSSVYSNTALFVPCVVLLCPYHGLIEKASQLPE